MTPSFCLLGPPELQHLPENNPKDPPVTVDSPEIPFENPPETDDDARMDLVVSDFNNVEITGSPKKGLTENLSATYLSTGNPCLDFFFHIVPDTPSETINQRLDLAWKHNPLTTLKLICHLRGVRNTGKSDLMGFYDSAVWLHEHHPKTLVNNLKHMVDFGYFKDLPEILYWLLDGPPDEREKKGDRKRFKWFSNKKGKRYYKRTGQRREDLDDETKVEGEKKEKRSYGSLEEKRIETQRLKKIKAEWIETLKAARESTKEERIEAEKRKVEMAMEKARNARKEKKVDFARKALNRYASDENYRRLHDAVAEVFAERLVSDLEALKSGEVGKISFAAKWCPSLDSSFDKVTLICETIARRVFPREMYSEYEGVEEVHYAYRVRDRLRKEVLVPLRQALVLPEHYMSKNEWNSLPYNRVASVAMTKYKKHFLKHDEERFKEYLEKVKKGEAKIAAGALLPHDIIKEALRHDDGSGEVAELQWRRMVGDLLEKGKLRNCIAICDVSGSMYGTPMDVCVALGLLISELSEEPWKGSVITFSAEPELHKIEGDNLKSKTEFVKEMDFGFNTDFQKVFDRILEVAINGKLSGEKMIKKLFVFSDMEFDQASATDSWATDYEVIQKKFEESGYEVPQIVFWNLRDSMATPVIADQKGVALVSGFSKNMVKLFLEEDEENLISNPENVMNEAINGPEFDQLVVVD